MNAPERPPLGSGGTFAAIALGIGVASAVLSIMAGIDLALGAGGGGSTGLRQHLYGAALIGVNVALLAALIAALVVGVRIAKQRPFVSIMLITATIVTAIPAVPCSIGLGITAGVGFLTS